MNGFLTLPYFKGDNFNEICFSEILKLWQEENL